MTDRQQVRDWIDAYERAWRTAGVEPLPALFTDDASYRQGPYHPPVVGLAAIGEMWEAERAGADEAFTMSYDLIAVEGDTAVVRVEVNYGDPVPQEFLDLWIMRFAGDGRCCHFEEWPYWPDATTFEPD
ncbi:MAG TPA: nuclear transport factor 2 family protein [Nocardioidaceae bacterium]|nr:nuclear transport factor 2 family protein [Nocardioidaceae bacterium]